ncbi:MAG: hypothetical protein WAK60_01960 [Sedimentisphaerales bacterium]
MNSFRLKITGAVVLTLVATIGIYVLCPPKTKPIAKFKDTKHLQKDEKHVPKIARHDGMYPKNSQARKFHGEPPKLSQKQNYFSDTETGLRYPDKLQARSGDQQLYKVPGRYYNRNRYNAIDVPHLGIADSEPLSEPLQWQPEQSNIRNEAKNLEFLESLKLRKPVERRGLGPPEGAELKISEEQMKKMNEAALLHILEEYKDNPKQAEQIEKILLERLKHFQEQSNAADKETSEKK